MKISQLTLLGLLNKANNPHTMKTKLLYLLMLFLCLVFYTSCGGGTSTLPPPPPPTPTPTPTPSSNCSNSSPGTATAGSELFYLGDNAGCIHGYGLDPASGNLTPIAVNNTSAAANVGLAADLGGMVLYSSDATVNVPNVSSWIVDKHTGILTANPGVQLSAPPSKLVPFSTYLYAIADPNAKAATMWVFKIDPLNGALSLLSDHTTQLPGVPFGVAIDPTGSGSFLFVLWDGVPGGKISTLSRDATTGQVTVLPTPADTAGLAPSAVAVTADGKFVVVVNQRSNNLAVFSLDHSTGALTAVPGSPFPSGPQPGPMIIDPSGKFVLVADSGNNNLTPYTIASAGSLTAGVPVSLGEANSQPSAIAVDPAGKFVFVGIFNQQVAGFTLDPNTGSLKTMPGSPFSGSPGFVTHDMVFVPGVTQ